MIAPDKLDRLVDKVEQIFNTIGHHAGALEYSRAVHAALPPEIYLSTLAPLLEARGLPLPYTHEQIAAAHDADGDR